MYSVQQGKGQQQVKWPHQERSQTEVQSILRALTGVTLIQEGKRSTENTLI